MKKPDLVYTTFIKTTPEKLWEAITNPEFTRQYWAGNVNASKTWEKGAQWEHVSSDGKTIHHVGEVVESIPPERLVMTWADPGDTVDVSRLTFEIEQQEGYVRLNVVHGDFIEGSVMATRVAGGWPWVLSSMKSYLETGKGLEKFGQSSCAEKQVKSA